MSGQASERGPDEDDDEDEAPTGTAAAVEAARHQFWHIIHGGVLGTFVENDKAKGAMDVLITAVRAIERAKYEMALAIAVENADREVQHCFDTAARLAAAERVVEAAREDASGPCTQYRGRCATCNYDYLPCRRDELRSALVAYDTLKEQVK